MSNATVALILAGGRGTRMGVLCQTRPKPTLSYGGTHRVADFTLSNCVNSGMAEVAALVDHQRAEMTRYLKSWRSATRGLQSLTVLHPRSGSYAGTADAVYQNRDYLMSSDAANVLILAGDHVYNMDYRAMVAFHREIGGEATVAVVRVPFSQAHRFGTVVTDADGRISEFVEKSSRPSGNLASMGIYVFNKDALIRYVSGDAADQRSPHDFGYAVLPEVLGQGRLYAYEFKGYWQDVGTVEAYYRSQMDLVGERPNFAIDARWPIASEFTPKHETGSIRGNVVNSVISAGCMIEGYVENSVLSPGVRVGKHAEVRNSVVMAHSRIGYHSLVDSCILDERVSVGDLCCVGFGGSPARENPKITVLGTQVTVPDQTAVGCGCVIDPHAGPESFCGAALPPGPIIAHPA